MSRDPKKWSSWPRPKLNNSKTAGDTDSINGIPIGNDWHLEYQTVTCPMTSHEPKNEGCDSERLRATEMEISTDSMVTELWGRDVGLFRPRWTGSGSYYVLPVIFFSFATKSPSSLCYMAAKLCRTIGNWLHFIIQVQNFAGWRGRSALPPINSGQLHAKFQSILYHFKRWSRIYPEGGNISKIGKTYGRERFLLRLMKKFGELRSTNYKEYYMWVWTH